MDTGTIDTYKRIRRENPHIGARNAFLWARGIQKPTRLDWDTFAGDHVAVGKTEQDGFDIRVIVDYDMYGDYRVEETDEDTGIRNPKYDAEDRFAYGAGRTKRYLALESGTTVRELAPYNHRAGMSKNVAWETARQSLEDEAREYTGDDYIQVVFRAEAWQDGVRLGDASGFASDFIIDWRYSSFERELEEAVLDTGLIGDAIEDARNTVKKIVKRNAEKALTIA